MKFSLPLLSTVAAQVASWNAAASTACSCSSGFIPVPMDITRQVDPSNPNSLNSTDRFQLRTTFQVFGVLCQPGSKDSKYTHSIQLLLHGATYTSQYWDVTWNGFQNYSYIAHSCSRGISSFAYDNIGAGKTRSGGLNLPSTYIQMPTAANLSSLLARDLKSGRVSSILTGTEKKYRKVIAFGHSLGSVIINQAAIAEGAHSPFDGLVLTGNVHDPHFLIQNPVVSAPASEVDPVRWPNLDPGYITTPNISARLLFYGPTDSSFSSTLFRLDELTKDVTSKWLSVHTYIPAFGFKAPVIELVGSLDAIHCTPNGQACDQAELQVSESVYFPNSKNFTMVVIDGYGHNVNFEYGAAGAFRIMTQLFEDCVT